MESYVVYHLFQKEEKEDLRMMSETIHRKLVFAYILGRNHTSAVVAGGGGVFQCVSYAELQRKPPP